MTLIRDNTHVSERVTICQGIALRIGEMNELYVVVWTKRLRKGSAINASRSWILWKNPVVVPQRCFS